MTYEELKELRLSPFWITRSGARRFECIYRKNREAFKRIEADINKQHNGNLQTNN